jgi:hypothetical protein
MMFLSSILNTPMVLMVSILVLLVATYAVTIRDQKEDREHFLSKTIPEFNWKTYNKAHAACKAAMNRCRSNQPFCMDLKRGTGPTLDCIKTYMSFFGEKNGFIPTYSNGDWGAFHL